MLKYFNEDIRNKMLKATLLKATFSFHKLIPKNAQMIPNSWLVTFEPPPFILIGHCTSLSHHLLN